MDRRCDKTHLALEKEISFGVRVTPKSYSSPYTDLLDCNCSYSPGYQLQTSILNKCIAFFSRPLYGKTVSTCVYTSEKDTGNTSSTASVRTSADIELRYLEKRRLCQLQNVSHLLLGVGSQFGAGEGKYATELELV